MEIESKFVVTGESDFQALENLSEVASYTLSEAEVQLIEDVFLDTQGKTIMAVGYYLRVRKALGEQGRWVTIKSLGGFEGGTHRREEYVSFLPDEFSVLECPDFRIRNMLFEFTAGLDLLPLLSLKQKRIIRQVRKGEKTVAEIYLDRVNLKSKGREKKYSEFEVELKPEGKPEDLENIRYFLLEHYNLTENPFSKFERAFLFMENLPEKTLLSLQERAFCEQLADQKNVYGKKAKILLELDKGRTCEELNSLLKVPQTEIETIRSKFEKERLSIFPFRTDKGKNDTFHFKSRSISLKKEKKEPEINEWSPESLLEYYGADKNRAEKARKHAFTLFDGLSTIHGLEKEERKLLGLATFLKDIVISTSPEEKILLTREILLTHSIKGLRLHEVLMLFLIAELQNPCISEKELVSTLKNFHTKLSPGFQNKALTLTAILRIGDLFDSPEIRPGKIREFGETLEIELVGVQTEKTIKKAEKKSELWKCLFGKKPLFTQLPEGGKGVAEKELRENKEIEKFKKSEKKKSGKKNKPLGKVTVKPTDSMADLACRIFSFQFSSMLSHEKGTIKGEEIEDLHDMRVAVRRMRAAARVFEDYLDLEELEPHLKGLKRTLGSLGEVRDLDVFREKAEKYLKTLPLEHENDLVSLFALLSEERKKARKKMLDYLESEKYSHFKKDFSDVLDSPETLALPITNKKHDALPHRVMDVLPAILYARLADITAYSEWIEGPYVSVERLHRLRIASKGMRYTLEFFESVLGEDAKSLIKDFKALQDHLGDLHDSVIAVSLLRSYLRTGEWASMENEKVSGKERYSEGMEGIEAYLAYREEEFQMLLDTFPNAWEKIRSGDFRIRVESSIKNLYESS
jgi:CHAD domain-containing protein/inorganic triphosphatase YgiF